MIWKPNSMSKLRRMFRINQRLAEATADRYFDSVSEGLAQTQKEKARFTFRKCRV